MKKIILSLTAILFAVGSQAQTQWKIDPSHSNIGFSISHMVISETEGEFKEFDASVTSSTEDFSGASVEFSANVSSIDTDNDQRDGHLKSEDFFNAEEYPTLSFKGKLNKKGKSHQLVGDFTMHGVTKKVTFPVEYNGTITDPYGNVRSGFKIKANINRTDYELKYNSLTEAGGLVVGEEVTIICNVELIKKG